MDLVYVDTCVFLDALLERESRSGRDLGTPAMSLFSRSATCQFRIIVSDWTLEELYKNIEVDEKVEEFFSDIEHKIERCGYSDGDIREAKKHSDHWQDFLHGIIAEREGADCIITRNIDDFRILSGVQIKLPSHI